MAFQEAGDDRDDGRRLGGVALETADLQGESGPIDQQPDNNLRVDPPFLGIPDLAELVLGFGFEIERRDVVKQKLSPPQSEAWVKHFAAIASRYLPGPT